MVGNGRGSSGFHGHRGELVAHVHLPSDTYYCTHVHMVGNGRGSSGFHGHRGELVAHVHLPSDTYYCTHVHMVGVCGSSFLS